MTSESTMLRLDAVRRLCVVCGTVLPADHVQARTDRPAGTCASCGSLDPRHNNPEQIAQVVCAADPGQLRAERLRIIEDSATIEQLRRAPGTGRHRDVELGNRLTTLRAAFLASIGAVRVPVDFYTVWLDRWERDAGRSAYVSERSFGESEFGEYDRTATLYPLHYRCWLATIPFRRDELLPLLGASQLALFLPPSTSAEFLQDIDVRTAAPLPGHSSVQGLHGRGRRLHAWSLGDKPFPPTAYSDIDEIRSNRSRMRTLRRTWRRAAHNGNSDMVIGMDELWPIEKVAEFLGCSQSRARAIMADRGITRVSGYPAAKVQQVQRRQGARTDLA